MDNKKKIEIPFGAFDSELYYQEINIPDGFEATIKDNKIILKRKDSKDDRIRKAIIEHIKGLRYYDSYYSVTPDEMIAWLEKQGNPADMIEPKFKNGQWIVFNGLTLYVNEVVQGYYRTTSIDGIPNSYDWNIDNAARLWTIQDAKDGDVLANSKVICIYKKHRAKHLINTHITYSVAEDVREIDDTIGDFNLHPATQEERELLFEKIHEARCEWDADKKELRKIEKQSERKPNRVGTKEATGTLKEMLDDIDPVELEETRKEMLEVDGFNTTKDNENSLTSKNKRIIKDIIWCIKHSGIESSKPINYHVTTTVQEALTWLLEMYYAYNKGNKSTKKELLDLLNDIFYKSKDADFDKYTKEDTKKWIDWVQNVTG